MSTAYLISTTTILHLQLVQYLAILGAEVEVVRNDEISVDEIAKINPDKIVIRRDPCPPNRPAFR